MGLVPLIFGQEIWILDALHISSPTPPDRELQPSAVPPHLLALAAEDRATLAQTGGWGGGWGGGSGGSQGGRELSGAADGSAPSGATVLCCDSKPRAAEVPCTGWLQLQPPSPPTSMVLNSLPRRCRGRSLTRIN